MLFLKSGVETKACIGWKSITSVMTGLFSCSANVPNLWHQLTVLSKHESVFLFDCHGWLTWKCTSERRGRKRACARVCFCERVCVSVRSKGFVVSVCNFWLIFLHLDYMCAKIRTVRVAFGAGKDSGRAVCEYGTCVCSFMPRLSALCLQVSDLLQLHQTNSFPTSDPDNALL